MPMRQRRLAEKRRTRLRSDVRPPAGGRASFWFVVLLVLAVVSGVALTYIRFNSEQVKMGRRLRALRREFALRSKELENLRIEVESYKNGAYIRAAVRNMQLGLREPDTGQVRRVRNGQLIPTGDWLQESMLARANTNPDR
jgi:cell division protein FtsL